MLLRWTHSSSFVLRRDGLGLGAEEPVGAIWDFSRSLLLQRHPRYAPPCNLKQAKKSQHQLAILLADSDFHVCTAAEEASHEASSPPSGRVEPPADGGRVDTANQMGVHEEGGQNAEEAQGGGASLRF